MFRGLLLRAFALSVVSALTALPAFAQSEADFIKAFSGDWRIFDSRFGAADGPCALSLGTAAQNGRYELVAGNCGGEVSGVSKWGIVDNQLALLDAEGKVLARMGGNQRRMTGTTASGAPVIFDRVNVQGGAAATIQAALKASGCFYLGFTNQCAPLTELVSPIAPGQGGGRKVTVLVNLNVREEPRDDAAVAGVVQGNSCVTVENCLSAVDGVWCSAKFGASTGWMRKVALRRDRWPVVTFLNQCLKPSS